MIVNAVLVIMGTYEVVDAPHLVADRDGVVFGSRYPQSINIFLISPVGHILPHGAGKAFVELLSNQLQRVGEKRERLSRSSAVQLEGLARARAQMGWSHTNLRRTWTGDEAETWNFARRGEFHFIGASI